jgi:hypothetical protein
MPILRILLLVALSTATPALAETLRTDTGNPATAGDRPNRGSSMSTVESRFGAPSNRHAAIGSPPISRWDYRQFSVYFENDRVLHTVLVRNAPAG